MFLHNGTGNQTQSPSSQHTCICNLMTFNRDSEFHFQISETVKYFPVHPFFYPAWLSSMVAFYKMILYEFKSYVCVIFCNRTLTSSATSQCVGRELSKTSRSCPTVYEINYKYSSYRPGVDVCSAGKKRCRGVMIITVTLYP